MKKEVIVINYMGRHGSGNMHAIVMAKALQEAAGTYKTDCGTDLPDESTICLSDR